MSFTNASSGASAAAIARSSIGSGLPRGTVNTGMCSASSRRIAARPGSSIERPSLSTTTPDTGRAAARARAWSIAAARLVRRPAGEPRSTPSNGSAFLFRSNAPPSNPSHATVRSAASDSSVGPAARSARASCSSRVSLPPPPSPGTSAIVIDADRSTRNSTQSLSIRSLGRISCGPEMMSSSSRSSSPRAAPSAIRTLRPPSSRA